MSLERLLIVFYDAPDPVNGHAAPEGPVPVIASFGAGCVGIGLLFRDFSVPQAIIGTTDMKIRSI